MYLIIITVIVGAIAALVSSKMNKSPKDNNTATNKTYAFADLVAARVVLHLSQDEAFIKGVSSRALEQIAAHAQGYMPTSDDDDVE